MSDVDTNLSLAMKGVADHHACSGLGNHLHQGRASGCSWSGAIDRSLKRCRVGRQDRGRRITAGLILLTRIGFAVRRVRSASQFAHQGERAWLGCVGVTGLPCGRGEQRGLKTLHERLCSIAP